jgi:hypothetical protein
MPFLFQGFENIWQEGDEAFGTNAVQRLPNQHQRLFNLRSIMSAKRYRSNKNLLDMIEQPSGIFVCVPSDAHKLFQNLLLLRRRCTVIGRRNLPEQDSPSLCPQSVSYVFLLNLPANQRSLHCLTKF